MVSSPLKGPPTFLLLLESACPLRVHQGARGHPLDPGLYSLRWLVFADQGILPSAQHPSSERECMWRRSGTLAIPQKKQRAQPP